LGGLKVERFEGSKKRRRRDGEIQRARRGKDGRGVGETWGMVASEYRKVK
jgi:hypothetical protein